MRRTGANLRVTTQLLEAETGTAIWTAKFDRPLAELADLQEELVTDIAASLDTQVYALEMERALRKPGEITAWEALARANSAYSRFDETSLRQVIDEARRSVSISPDYAPGHALLATALADSYFGMPDDPAEVQRIRATVGRALALAPDDITVLGWVAHALSIIGHPEEAVLYPARAVRKATGAGILHFYHGEACCLLNRNEEALIHLGLAERLLPGWNRIWALKIWQSAAFSEMGRWVEADSAIDESISLIPTHGLNYLTKASLCPKLGRDAEAASHIETARQLGWDLKRAERAWRRLGRVNTSIEALIAATHGPNTPPEPAP